MKLLVGVFILVSCNLSFSQSLPAFANVTAVQFSGAGCDAGSARAIVTDDLKYLSILYDKFSVEIGNGTIDKKAKKREKSCTIALQMRIPAGWDFQFESVEYRGFVSLPHDLSAAYQFISIESQGGRGITFDYNIIRGPRTDNFVTLVQSGKDPSTANDNKSPLDDIRSILDIISGVKNQINKHKSGNLIGCSGQDQLANIKIKSKIGVGNLIANFLRPQVKMVVDSTDATFQQRLKLNWSRCN